ncbi:MAG: hypothetical protein WCL02_05900 [bacterium]
MNKKTEKMIILDLTQDDYIASIPCAHESPAVQIFEFWTEKNEKINQLERIKHDTQKIYIKTGKGLEMLKLSINIQTNLLEYFKHKNEKGFRDFTCHEFLVYLIYGTIEKKIKYTLQKTEDFQIGDTILLGSFKKIFWKTIHIYSEHSAICIAKTDKGILFLSKLGDKEKVVVTTMDELKKIYWATTSYAKITWKE